MYCILRGMIVSDCQQSNTRFKRGSTLPIPRVLILRVVWIKPEIKLKATESNWIKSDFLSTGAARCVLQIRSITNGHSGFLFNFLNLTTVKMTTKQNTSMSLSLYFLKKEMVVLMSSVMIILYRLLLKSGMHFLPKNSKSCFYNTV